MNDALQFHPKAKLSFDGRGDALASELPSAEQPTTPEPRYVPDLPVAAHITEKDIVGAVLATETDASGNLRAMIERGSNYSFAVSGDHFAELHRLAAMHRSGKMRDVTTVRSMERHVFDWLRLKHQAKTVTSLSEQVEARILDSVRERELLVLLHGVFIERPFPVGRVLLRQVSSNDVDAWHARQTNVRIMKAEHIDAAAAVMRKEWQGRTVAQISVRADSARVEEIAIEETENAASLLRMVSDAMLHPNARSYCTVTADHQPTRIYIAKITNGVIDAPTSRVDGMPEASWTLSRDGIDRLIAPCIAPYSALATKTNQTELEERILQAAAVYSRAALYSNAADLEDRKLT